MKRIRIWSLLCHATIILASMFIIFFCIDRVNPAMGFIDSEISKWVLLSFCLVSLSSSVFSVYAIRKAVRKRIKRKSEEALKG